MDFTASIKDGIVQVKAIAVQDGPNVTIHVPSFRLIQKLRNEHGKRNIQQI